VTLAVLGGALAQAQCRPPATATRLTIKGFASAYFQQFRTDTEQNSAELYGGVCLVGADHAWTLAADRVSVSGLQGALRVTAVSPTLSFQGWSATAGSLDATSQTLSLGSVELTGHGVSGTAETLRLDLASGALELTAIDLHGAAFYLRGDSATLSGDRLGVTAPSVTTCHCAGPPLYRVDGASAQVAVQGQRIVLSGGHVVVGKLEVPLASPVTIDAAALKALTLPLTIEDVTGDAVSGTPAAGLEVLLTHLGLAPGIYAQLGVAGLDAGHPLAGIALLRGGGHGTSFTFGEAPGGMRYEETSDQAITPWFDAGFDTRVLEPGNRDTLREGVLHARLHTGVAPLHGSAALAMFAAGSSQQPSTGEVAGARLGARASIAAATPPAPWGHLSLRLGGEASLYPDQRASQWGVDVQPGYGLRAGPLDLQVSYLARFTDGGSPFTTSLDRLEPVERPSGSVTLAGALAPGWRGSARLAAQIDLVGNSSVAAGVNQLDVSGSLTRSLGAWQLSVSGDAVLAGIVTPNGARDGFLQAAVGASRGDLALGAEARYRYAPAYVGLDLLQVSAAVPIALPGAVVRPYLALDLAPTVTSGALPTISGHGLDLTLPTCCGALKLGYRDDGGTWTVSVAVDLQTHMAQASSGATCPTRARATPTIADPAAAAPVCAAGSDGTGIMTGAATGPPL